MEIKVYSCSRAILSFGLLASATLTSQTAEAHIDLDQAGTHVSRSGGGLAEIKAAPCGVADSTRGDNVYTYKPGSTIEISVAEYISHPGYFRIAFDDDGAGDFVTPVSITGEHGDCFGDPKCGAGMEDFCNNDTVLLDNLDPHPGLGFVPGPTYTWKVKLPDVECDNCTLQIIQVMTDLDIHRADYPADDIYYQCIDLVLSSEATDEGVEPEANANGIDCKADEPMGGAGGAGGEGGMGGAGGVGGESGGSGGMGGAGGTGGAGGAGGTGTTAGTGGAGGSGGSIGVPGGSGGAAGAAGVMGGAAGMTAAGTGAPSSSSSDDSGCAASGTLQPKHLLGTLLPLGLALLLVRRRRNA